MKKIVLGTTLVLVGIALYTSLALAAETSPLANAIAKQLETAPQSIDMQAAPGLSGDSRRAADQHAAGLRLGPVGGLDLLHRC